MTDDPQATPGAEQPDFFADAAREAAEQAAAEASGASAKPAEPASYSADDAAAMAEELLAQVHMAVSDANTASGGRARGGASSAPPASPAPPPPGSKPLNLPSFDAVVAKPMPAELDLLADVNLHVKIELGRTRLLVDDVLRLGDGSVVELDKLAGDPVDIYVNERHIARGEVLVLNDNFCVRINEIVEPDSRIAG
ncbi:MAG: flagellar motor switch protein FliN [Phycisphaerales bacterium]|nr:flagellar motor switch protein FliN [Phycisphaerales bacterium]